MSEAPKNYFGVELEKFILAKYRNRAAFLKAAGLENQTVRRWETRPAIPREQLLELAANALGVSVGMLQEIHRKMRSMDSSTTVELDPLTKFLASGTHNPISDEELIELRAWRQYRSEGLRPEHYARKLDDMRGKPRPITRAPKSTEEDPVARGKRIAQERGGRSVRRGRQ